MDEITPTPNPTGLAVKLQDGQEKCKQILEKSTDITQHPKAISILGWLTSITQNLRIVNLLGEILTEIKEYKAKPIASTWIDAKGVNFLLTIDRGVIYTYLADGSDYAPVEPCRLADGLAISMPIATEISAPAPSEPIYTRRIGMEELTIAAGATRISITVLAGEVSCSNGDGVIPAGCPTLFYACASGLTELLLNGDPDADYIVTAQYPLAVGVASPVANREVVIDAPSDISQEQILPELAPEPIEDTDAPPLTGDLIPEVAIA